MDALLLSSEHFTQAGVIAKLGIFIQMSIHVARLNLLIIMNNNNNKKHR